MRNLFTPAALLLFAACLAGPGQARDILVDSQAQFGPALQQARPGDQIVLKDGTWQHFEIGFFAEGRAGAPITLRAQTPGKVILSGQSNLRLAGRHLLVKGLVFKNGHTPTGEVISFRRRDGELAHHSRVTEVVIDDYNNPDRDAADYWVALYGRHNRFDHSYLVGKRNLGVTLAVRLDNVDSQQNHHRIDHNYFGPRPTLGSNGGETLRVGTSPYSLTNSHTVIEDNFFERCNGEVEIISIKSGRNIVRNNVFLESRGTLTLRHGNGNLVEGNVFFGNGVPNTGGIRVINRDQVVRNNYLEGLRGTRFGSGFAVMNGSVDAPANRYGQVLNASIVNNTLIDVSRIELGAGRDSERDTPPASSRMRHNLIVDGAEAGIVTLHDDMTGLGMADNLFAGASAQAAPPGFAPVPPAALALRRNAHGLLMPTNEAHQHAGAAASLRPLARQQSGPAWYPKPDGPTPFDSGRQIPVDPARDDGLATALAGARAGDQLVLAPGRYRINRQLPIETVVTLRAAQSGSVVLLPERTTLFEIRNGGSLKLSDLAIDGSASPDAAGNILIRTPRSGMIVNYRLFIDNVRVENLDVNHSHHFLDVGHRSLADEIRITGSTFSKISGDLLKLDRETDDLGNYNVERLVIDNNRFARIGGALLSLYRGGTDESTFGPQLEFTRNQVEKVGQSSRNKRAAALFLHGVQHARISENIVADSAGSVIVHTIGDPDTEVRANVWRKTPAPRLVELHAKGPSTVRYLDNQQE